MHCALTISPVSRLPDRGSRSPVARCCAARGCRGREAADAAVLRLALFLLEGFGAALAEVGEVDEADGLRFEQVFGGGGL
jgi:hypothetical protein